MLRYFIFTAESEGGVPSKDWTVTETMTKRWSRETRMLSRVPTFTILLLFAQLIRARCCWQGPAVRPSALALKSKVRDHSGAVQGEGGRAGL